MRRLGYSALAVALALPTVAGACSDSGHRTAAAPAAAPTTTTTVDPPTTRAPVFTGYLVADIHTAVPGYATPGGTATTTVPASWYGAPSDLAVIGVDGSWLHVRLAQRPNESTVWVQESADVTLAQTQYRIVVDLAARHLELFDHGAVVLDAPAGIGTPTDPTPTGQFFVAFFAAPPDPGYGPFVLVTSAHSDAITDWEESGDAIVAIHGPIDADADADIGTTGAAISHGCIRLHDSDLEQLRNVPAGTPIDIIN